MALFKCKMCGGDLEIIAGSTVAQCEYCGSIQTLPNANDENLQNLYNRANALRFKSEFDKAEKLYEKIIQEDNTQAEAYWGLILCKYGIEYVDDPATGKKIPTCHRASYDPIVADDDYKAALANADISQRSIYEEQAKEISLIQKDILALAQKEESYDVFICYKETDESGKRTHDSAIANEIYYQLTKEGFKVFYAAITLEGKLGREYEPIIFAALNSAKVMLVVGTKPEYFNAVWVKNEWSRYLKIVKKDRNKLLIPCYKDMDAYDLPDEFAHLQAQDMSKIGFIADLVRGIEKLVGKNEPQKAVAPAPQPVAYSAAPAATANVDTLLQRVSMFIDDRDWDSANIYCEKVLDIEPTNGRAYFYKLLVEARVKNEGALQSYNTPLESLKAYKNAVRYADETTTAKLIEWNKVIKERLAQEERERQEQERIRKERQQQEEQRRREKAQRDAEFQKNYQSLSTAIANASTHISAKVREKEQLEFLLNTKQKTVNDTQKNNRKIRTLSLLVMSIAAIIFLMLSGTFNSDSLGFLLLLQVVLAVYLSYSRGKSLLSGCVLSLFTVGLFPFFSGVKALIDIRKPSSDGTEASLNSIRSKIQQLDNQIATSRKGLSELNRKKDDLMQSRKENEND